MEFALVLLNNPNIDSKDLTFFNYVNKVAGQGIQQMGVEIVNPGAYLCSLANGLGGLNCLINEAQSRGIPFRTLLFEQAPSWLNN